MDVRRLLCWVQLGVHLPKSHQCVTVIFPLGVVSERRWAAVGCVYVLETAATSVRAELNTHTHTLLCTITFWMCFSHHVAHVKLISWDVWSSFYSILHSSDAKKGMQNNICNVRTNVNSIVLLQIEAAVVFCWYSECLCVCGSGCDFSIGPVKCAWLKSWQGNTHTHTHTHTQTHTQLLHSSGGASDGSADRVMSRPRLCKQTRWSSWRPTTALINLEKMEQLSLAAANRKFGQLDQNLFHK